MKKLISLEVHNSNFFESPFKITFSDHLTCIMGGRGTGKSTILHFIKACLDENAEEDRDTFNILENNLGSGLISLTLSDDNDELYRIEKTLGEEPQPYIISSNKHVPISNIKWQLNCDIFPAQMIEEIGRNSEARLMLIDKMLGDQIDDSLEEIEKLKVELSKNANDIRVDNTRISRLNDLLLDYKTADDELVKFRNEQPEDIKEDERLEFDKQDAAERNRGAEQRYLKRLLGEISTHSEKLISLNEDGNNIFRLLKGTDSFENKDFFKALIEALGKPAETLLNYYSESEGTVGDIISKIESAQVDLKILHDQQHNVFVQLKQKLDKNKVFFDKLNSLSKRVDQKNVLQKELEDVIEKKAKFKESRQKTMVALSSEKTKILEKRLAKIKELNDHFSPRIKITLTPGGITTEYDESLRNALKGHSLRYNTIVPYITRNLSPEKLAKVIHENDTNSLKDISGIDQERSSAVMNALHESEAIYEIESIYCPDLPDFHLMIEDARQDRTSKRDDYRKSDELSTGQRCTTVLPIAFSISLNPLIIDQPEDNLDNKYIYETINRIIKSQKLKRQLILITHNANIPVLSEAEQNIFLKYDEGRSFVQADGDVDEVQENIVSILEGGRQAFELRKKVYGY